MKVLYLTSFIPRMYGFSGKRLIRSFLETETEGEILCGVEGYGSEGFESPDERITSFTLDDYDFLQKWLHDNRDVIPKELGGEAEIPKGVDPQKTTIKLAHWWNKNMSRWFRKVACLNWVVDNRSDIEMLVWIDCDCVFTNRLTVEKISETFKDTACFYCKSKRPVLEAGLVGYHFHRNAQSIIKTLVKRYVSKRYRWNNRWDDSPQLQKAIFKNRESDVLSRDIANSVGRWSAVVSTSELKDFIRHDKGRHKRKGLMQ